MKNYIPLFIALIFIISCSNEDPEPETALLIGTYQGAGTYVDINVSNFIFNTKVEVTKSGDSFLIELEDNTPSPTITLPEKIYIKIYETKNDVSYFHIVENTDFTETPSNGIDDFNCFDLREEQEIQLHIDISGLNPDNPYKLWFNAWKLR